MSQLSSFFTIPPSQRDHVPAARIALSVAVPLLVLLAVGRTDLAIYAVFGSFAALYGRNEPVRARIRHQAQAGLLVVLCVVVGALMSNAGLPEPAVLAVTAVIAGLGALVAAYLTLKPAGSLFFIFAAGAVGTLPAAAPAWQAGCIAAVSAALSVGWGIVFRYVGEGVRGPVASVPAHHGLTAAQLWAHAGRFFLAAGAAAVLGSLSGLSHSYWAMVAAAAPIAAPDLTARMQRAVHRVIGTLGGVGVTAFLLSLQLQSWHIVVFVIILQFLAELFVGRNYAVALLFVTPLALLMTELASPGQASSLLQARAVETVIGAACGLAVVYVFRSREERIADTRAVPLIRQATGMLPRVPERETAQDTPQHAPQDPARTED
ncbi:FUSC family protein [Kocuria varians]|uniref:FUSC family protein n=1 Tax=Kocuria varians TaxID=1272 RepID=A0A4Y4D3M1_KOCVA|nr:FUSC family protein [Kocuria varians]GEC98153.1 FUSC family protein [Kocuria varians]